MTKVLQLPATRFEPARYGEQLAEKERKLASAFARLSDAELEVFASSPEHYRMRAEFRIWHDRASGLCQHVMFEPGQPQQPIPVTQFPVAHNAIDSLMPRLLAAINLQTTLKQKLFQIEYLCSTGGELLVTLIYHRQLDDAWEVAARTLAAELDIHIIGRARRQRLVLSQDFVTETLQVNGRNVFSIQPENSFTQPNAGINAAMINWVDRQLQSLATPVENDLLELYCGNGNFTIPLANHFRRVLATEISKRSISAAIENCRLNKVGNIDFVRLSSEETVQALRGDRPFRRLKDVDLESLQPAVLLVDPPRAGLDDASRELARKIDLVVYISCNPETLLRDLAQLMPTHTVCANALFDQFPYTDHCECGVILKRNA